MQVSDRDRILLETHSDPISWDQCAQIIQIGDLRLFRRSPAQLVEYLEAKQNFNKTDGSIAEHILKHRLHWVNELKPSGDPFLTNPKDIKIIRNDFPYYFEPGIDHLVVWSKTKCPCDPKTEQPIPEIKQRIEKFLDDTFAPLGIDRKNVMWFKNNGSLQSVPTLEHFHILIKQDGWQPLVGTAGALDNTR